MSLNSLTPRSMLERLSRGWSFWRQLPEEFDRRPIKVTPDSALRYLNWGARAYDPMLLNLAVDHVGKGAVVWDVGANVGVFALAAAARGAEVLAIEPDPWLHSLLLSTGRHPKNRDLSFDALCCAIAAECGVTRLQIAVRGRSANCLEGLSSGQMGGIRHSLLVPVLTLDTLLQHRPAPALIKIDVEGAEALVMRGAQKLLAEVRPIFFIQSGKEKHGEVLGNLVEQRYSVTSIETGEIYTGEPCGGFNFIAIPH